MKLTVLATLSLLASLTASGQLASSPAFEVASVKPRQLPKGSFAFSASSGSAVKISGNRVTTEGTLAGLILAAYNLKIFQLSGAPTLSDNMGREQLYVVEAKTPGDAEPAMDQVRQMLRTLLEDRFRLKSHREMKELPVYELMPGNNPSKLRRSTPGEATRTDLLSASALLVRTRYTNVAITDLLTGIASLFDRPVFDKTGLAGGYDFTLEYSPSRPGAPVLIGADDGPSIITAIRDQLGLKVVPAKEPVEILAIDHAEKPSAN